MARRILTQMNATDLTIADLQERLHAQNQRRFEQIEKNQDNQRTLLEQLITNTATLPKLKEDVEKIHTTLAEANLPELKKTVESINEERNRLKGVIGLATFLGGGSALFEGIRWFLKH